MLVDNGSQRLRDFTEENFQENYTEITKGIWQITGLGHSNSICIEGESSVILIDTLDSLERGKILLQFIEEKIRKRISTIIYTHGHPDHRGGAGAFMESNPEVIAFSPITPSLEGTAMLQDIQNQRGSRQFGYNLTDGENISQGIGRREGIAYGEQRVFVPPTTVYQQDQVVREIDGIKLELTRVPGETEDQIMIWLPEKKVLCCGDTYYGCFPNLYAIRGGQYRDLAQWLHSLDKLASYRCEYLLPGHTAAVIGSAQIQETLQNFRKAIDDILTRTLVGMNQGKSADHLAAEIRLQPEYASLPYLGEFYGCAEWTVRAIYAAYLGWFDGNPTHLHPLPPEEKAVKTIALMGGSKSVLGAAKEALITEEYQWTLELCDLLLDSAQEVTEAKALKASALRYLAEYETSANGRHYYLASARELTE